MTANEQDAETLAALGLNSTQAKVYLSLLSLGRAKAKTIWKSSRIARQDIYRVLNELERKSLVEKTVDTPAEFRAIPLRDGLSVLLKERAQEYNNLKKKTNELLERFTTNQKENAAAKEFEFKIISTKDAYLRRLKDAVATTQRSIDILDSFDHARHRATIDSELITALYEKNVRFRLIINRPKDGQRLPKVYTLNRNKVVDVRFIPTEPAATLRIDDKKQVSLSVITAIHKPEEAPRIVSDSPCLVAILQDYFERVWNEAAEVNIRYPSGKFNCALPAQE